MTHSLWLVQVDDKRPVLAVRGVRAAIKMLGGPLDGETDSPRGSIRVANDLMSKVRAHNAPMMIGTSLDLGAVEDAHAVLQAESEGAALGAVDLSPEDALSWAEQDMPAPEADDEGEEPLNHTVEHYQTALVLLALGDGRAMNGVMAAKLLAQAASDPEFFSEVEDIFGEVFIIKGDA